MTDKTTPAAPVSPLQAKLNSEVEAQEQAQDAAKTAPAPQTIAMEKIEQTPSFGTQNPVGTQQAASPFAGKPLVFDAIGQKITDDARITKEKLWKEEMTSFLVPLEPGEKAGQAEETVQINGYKLTIKKGVFIPKLPMSVAIMLAAHYNINMGNVGMNMRIDRDERTRNALS